MNFNTMKELLAGLIVYKNMNRGEILLSLAEIINDYKTARIGGSDLAYKKSAYINAI